MHSKLGNSRNGTVQGSRSYFNARPSSSTSNSKSLLHCKNESRLVARSRRSLAITILKGIAESNFTDDCFIYLSCRHVIIQTASALSECENGIRSSAESRENPNGKASSERRADGLQAKQKTDRNGLQKCLFSWRGCTRR